MKFLLPLILALMGTGAGVGAGLFLLGGSHADAASDADHAADCAEPAAAPHARTPAEDTPTDREYVKMTNQFVVPVVDGARVGALVVLSLSVEVGPGQRDVVYEREPKLRDAFLQVLFDHANIGGFAGAFTDARTLDTLRTGLRESARQAVGGMVTDVLITDIVRQDA